MICFVSGHGFRACVRPRSPRFWALSRQQSRGAPHPRFPG